MTAAWFLAYVEQILAPTLSPGDIVILDDLAAHKGAAARAVIEAVGAKLLFPAALQSRPQSDRERLLKAQGPR